LPDLQPYYAKKSLARPAARPRVGAVERPRIPDLSQHWLRGQQQLGHTIAGVAQTTFNIADQTLQAQEAGKLAQAEGALTEQMGLAYNTMITDQSIDPFEYGSRLQSKRSELIQTLGEGLGGRMQGTWQGTAARATDGLIIKADYQGKVEGVKRATSTLETTTDQLVRAQVAEPDPRQQAVIEQQIRDLHAGYVSSGILSPQDAQSRLLKLTDTRAIYQEQAAIGLDPDAAVLRLEQGPAANPTIPPEAYPKLLNQARQVQRERFNMREEQEAKVRRDTLQAQNEAEAVAFGKLQARQLGRSALDAMRDAREISPQGYETMVRYHESKAREDRAEARAVESAGRERRTAAYTDVTARLDVAAMLGMPKEQIIATATAQNLPPKVYDSAMAKAIAHERAQESQWMGRHNQGEQVLRSHFFKDAFTFMPGLNEQSWNLALTEYTERSKAYTEGPNDRQHAEDPLSIIEEIAQKHRAVGLPNLEQQITSLNARIEYPTADALQAAQPTLPPWKFKEQLRLVKQREEAVLQYEELHPKPKPQILDTRDSWWKRWAPELLGGEPAPGEATPTPPETKPFGHRPGMRMQP